MSRANAILLGVFAALAAILLVLEKPWEPDRFAQAATRSEAPIVPGFEPARASRIEIRKGKDEVVLEKRAQGWCLPALSEYRANEEAVARLLERIRSMTRADLVTKDRARHPVYRVQEGDAPRVVVKDGTGRVLADLLQGKLDPSSVEPRARLSTLDVYVRPTASDEVFRVSPFDPIEPVRASEWIPRNLFRFDVAAIESLVVEGPDRTEPVVLNHAPDGNWMLEMPGGFAPADKEACDALARSFASLFVDDVIGRFEPEKAAQYGLDKPRLHAYATLRGGGGLEDLIVGGDADAQMAYAVGGLGKTHVARVYKSSLDALRVPRASLFPKTAASTPASASASAPASAAASAPASVPHLPASNAPTSDPASRPR